MLGQSRIYNPETLSTLDTQDTGQRQTKQGAIKNVQSRDTGNIRYYLMLPVSLGCTFLMAPCFVCLCPVSCVSNVDSVSGLTLDTQDTGQRQTKQGAIKNGQSRDTGNIRYTRHPFLTAPCFVCLCLVSCCQYLWIVHS
jgi:hypothetical protein